MLRDLSLTNSNGSGIMGTPLVGVLASELPTGFALPGLLNNDVDVADPSGCLYRVEILAAPSAGVLTVDEFGAFSFAGAPDGTYTGTETVYKNGVSDAGSYSFTIGSITPPTPTVSSVVVSPASATVDGGGTVQLSAVVNGANSPSQAVTWAANGGTVSAGGMYTAPAALTVDQVFTATAASVQDDSYSGSATITVPAVIPHAPPPSFISTRKGRARGHKRR